MFAVCCLMPHHLQQACCCASLGLVIWVIRATSLLLCLKTSSTWATTCCCTSSSGLCAQRLLRSVPCVSSPGRSSVPGLLNVYRGGRAYGIVSSSSTTQLAWQATAAAAQQLPGSYLAFQLSTSLDGQAWQPVRFSHGVPAAGLGSLRGVYEPRLQGRLAAAGSGSLEDNMWLLSLADRLLEVRRGPGPGCRPASVALSQCGCCVVAMCLLS